MIEKTKEQELDEINADIKTNLAAIQNLYEDIQEAIDRLSTLEKTKADLIDSLR